VTLRDVNAGKLRGKLDRQSFDPRRASRARRKSLRIAEHALAPVCGDREKLGKPRDRATNSTAPPIEVSAAQVRAASRCWSRTRRKNAAKA